MAKIVMVDSRQNLAADTIEIFFTAPSGNGVVINAFTATNNTDSNKTYAAYIYRASTATERVIPLKILVRDAFDTAPSIVGQIMNSGDTLRMESSSAGSVVYRVTGNEL